MCLCRSGPAVGPVVPKPVELAHSLGLNVVAEGIEDADTAVALRGLGCDFGQGYHFARPVPVEQMLDRLEPPDFVATVVEPDESVPVLVDVGQAGAVPGE